MSASDRFKALDPASRAELESWLASVAHLGVDAAIDLSGRPWALPSDCVIIGIFRKDGKVASWLLVGDGLGWSVVNCASNDLAGSADTLSQALALITP